MLRLLKSKLEYLKHLSRDGGKSFNKCGRKKWCLRKPCSNEVRFVKLSLINPEYLMFNQIVKLINSTWRDRLKYNQEINFDAQYFITPRYTETLLNNMLP